MMLNKDQLINIAKTRKFQLIIVGIVISCLLPFLLSNQFNIYVMTLIIVFAIYASSWNLLSNSGQGSLGHAAFLGLGGFTYSLLVLYYGIPPVISMLIGALFSAGIGFLIGLTCVRLEAWFLGMVTFGFSVIIVAFVNHFSDITMGVLGFRTPLVVQVGVPLYYFSLLVSILSIFAMYFIMKSKIGLAFRAIKENSAEAKMIGINTAKYKLYAFIISTFFAGLAGSLYAQVIRHLDFRIFDASNSFEPLMMSVIGGLGTIEGPVIGSMILVSIDSFLPNIDPYLQPLLSSLFPAVSNVGPPIRLIILGVFLLLIVIFFPGGVISIIRRLYDYLMKQLRE